jgi:hypothetical protein
MLVATLTLTAITATAPACVTRTHLVTPEGQRAATVVEINQRLGEAQRAVVDLARAGTIPTQEARTIVEWISGDKHATPPTMGAVDLIASGVSGWPMVLHTSWVTRIRPLFARFPGLQTWVPVIDSLLP